METVRKKSGRWTATLSSYQKEIDLRIKEYSISTLESVRKQYGMYSADVASAYFDMLNRGGKRIRGALTMVGYEMAGGKNRKMIIDVAMAVEMLHSYMLIVDDFQDNSDVRRGGPSVHRMLANIKTDGYAEGDREHLGASLAWNAALFGSHAAQILLANVDADAELRTKALSIMNRTLLITAHGQTNDIINEMRADVDEKAVEDVMLWKTAYYTFLNPLHVGMVFAGADCHQTDAITDYATNAGLVFQITDDILGTFGDEFKSGKSPHDDMREGKRTLLTIYALEHAPKSDRNFLIQMLGNEQMTELEFNRCKEIMRDCGALQYAHTRAKEHCETALAALERNKEKWPEEHTNFLAELVTHLLERKA